MPLNDTSIRNAKPDIKQKKLYDSGAFIYLSPQMGVSGGVLNTDLGVRRNFFR